MRKQRVTSEEGMRLWTSYTLTFLSKLPDGFQIPLRIEMQGVAFEITEVDEDGKQASAFVDGPISTDRLQIRIGPRSLDGSQPTKGIEVPEQAKFSHLLSVFVNILSFLTDVPVRYSHKLEGDHLIAESEEDVRLLETFGTRQIYQSLQLTVSIRSFSLSQVSYDTLELLSTKEVGLVLYSQALLVQESVAVFREFWKVLESAFGAKNEELIQCLADYEPSKQLGFTHDELRRLLVLRGRASHAESRSGIDEHRYVTAETSKAIPRLKCLVEQVLLTKKTWGITPLETEKIARIESFIDVDGGVVMVKRASRED